MSLVRSIDVFVLPLALGVGFVSLGACSVAGDFEPQTADEVPQTPASGVLDAAAPTSAGDAAGAADSAVAARSDGAAAVTDGARAADGDATSPPPASSAKTFYGLNGHENQYSFGTFSDVRALLLDLGVTVYRNDVSNVNGAAKLASLAAALDGSGISILPVMLQGFSGTDEQTNYDAGFAMGQGVANKLKGLVTHYECGNELENDIVSNDGNHPDNYDAKSWPAYRGVIRGMIDGVKSADPNALVGPAPISWLHYGAYQMLWNGTNPDGSGGAPQVRWDFTPLHWYSDMQDVQHACGGTGCFNVLQELQSAFGKPIWVTEFGFRPTTEAAAASFLPTAFPMFVGAAAQYKVENVSWYDLFDDLSGNYGLIHNDGTTRKPAYDAYKSFIAANPM